MVQLADVKAAGTASVGVGTAANAADLDAKLGTEEISDTATAGTVNDILQFLDTKNYGAVGNQGAGLYEEWNGLLAAAAGDLTTAVVTPAGGSWLGAENNAGSVVAAGGMVTLTTDAANNDYSTIASTNWVRPGDAISTWNVIGNKIVFEAIVEPVITDVSTGNIFFGLLSQAAPAWVADADLVGTTTPARFGFAVTNASKAINAVVCDGTATSLAEALAAAPLNVEKHFKIIYDYTKGTPEILFYIADALTNTVTADLPAAGTIFTPYFAIEATAGAIAQTVRGVKMYYI